MAGPYARPGRRRPGGRRPLGAPPRRSGQEAGVLPSVRVAAAYSWRLLVIAAAVVTLLLLLGRLQMIVASMFGALVITSVLRPVANALARRWPRPLAVAVSLLGAVVVVLGVLAMAGAAVATEVPTLRDEFHDGLQRVQDWLSGPPLRADPDTVSHLGERGQAFISSHRSEIINSVAGHAGEVVEFGTGVALALFSSVFFINSGDRIWRWVQGQLPEGAHPYWDRAGRAAWRSFAGYTRGIIVVSASNAVLVGISLLVLDVPLVLPLTVLEFAATFIPLVGSPVALGVAAVIALATRGPVTALVLVALIVAIGQVEGHLLHPLVLSWAVQLHPVVVAVSVLAGGTLAGVVGAVLAVPAVSVAWAVVEALRGRSSLGPPRWWRRPGHAG